jgi:hypothetical protein
VSDETFHLDASMAMDRAYGCLSRSRATCCDDAQCEQRFHKNEAAAVSTSSIHAGMSDVVPSFSADVERPSLKTIEGYINVTTSLDLEPPLRFRRWFAQVADGAFCLYVALPLPYTPLCCFDLVWLTGTTLRERCSLARSQCSIWCLTKSVS